MSELSEVLAEHWMTYSRPYMASCLATDCAWTGSHDVEFADHLAAVVLDHLAAKAGEVAVVEAVAAAVGGDDFPMAVDRKRAAAALRAFLRALDGPGAPGRVEVAPGAADEVLGRQGCGFALPTYEGTCPRCNQWKFIGHGPLCVDCYCNDKSQESANE